jgi:lipid-A-disaccharide synthase
MKYYIIVGEASGDLHASGLVAALRAKDTQAEFRGWGGDLMANEGVEIVKHYRDLAFMGFTEVAANLRTIMRNLDFCKEDLLSYNPDVVILVDYPGFNLRIAKFAKAKGIKVFYYISPQIWAWKQSRVHQIKASVDEMFVILPFEKDFYARFGMDVHFVGHPLLDAVQRISPTFARKAEFCEKHGLDERPIVAVLPGSRKQEISKILPIMIAASKRLNGYQFVIAGAPSQQLSAYREVLGNAEMKVIFGVTYELLHNSHAAMVTSGTATLETAIFNVPQVVCYKGGSLSYLIARMLVKVKFISLVNLIMDREVVRELIQEQLSVSILSSELDRLCNDGVYRNQMFENYNSLRIALGGSGAAENTAGIMLKNLR